MKRNKLQRLENNIGFDYNGQMFDNNDFFYGSIKRQRIKTEISPPINEAIRQNKNFIKIEAYLMKQLQEIEKQKQVIKEKKITIRNRIENMYRKLQNKQQQIIVLEQKQSILAHKMSQYFNQLQNQSIIQPIQRKQKKNLRIKTLNDIPKKNDEFITSSTGQYNSVWNEISSKKSESQEVDLELQQQKQQIISLNREYYNLQSTKKQVINNLLNHLYSQCTLKNCYGQSIIDIMRKISKINQSFDINQLPQELDQFEKQYIQDKIQFENENQSTITLDESYSQKLKLKIHQKQIMNKSPIKLSYLKKIMGQESYQYIPLLQENIFKDLNKNKLTQKYSRVKSLEQYKYSNRECSLETMKSQLKQSQFTNEQYILEKMQQMEQHINTLESQLGIANKEINNLKTQKSELQQQLNQVQKISIGDELIEQINKTSVDKIIQRKEKTQFQAKKIPGQLKLDLLNQILSEYPNLQRPVIHIQLSDSDFV